MKRPSIKLVFTVLPKYVEYTEELGETVTARSIYLILSPRSPRWPQPEEQTLPSFQACAGPIVLAIFASRMPSGFGRPVVLSRAV
jgi:hypothetical protein